MLSCFDTSTSNLGLAGSAEYALPHHRGCKISKAAASIPVFFIPGPFPGWACKVCTMITRMATSRRRILCVIAWLALASGCAKLVTTGTTPLHPKNMAELQGYLLNHKPDLDYFRLRGPFAVAE